MTLAELGRTIEARAAGFWHAKGNHLNLVEFWSADDLAEDVAREFAEATRSVPLDRTDLGIVVAATNLRPWISIAKDLPPGVGSSLWLGRFGADRSIAVPLVNEGNALGVAAVAVRGGIDDAYVIACVSQFLVSGV